MANELVITAQSGAALAMLDEAARARANFAAWADGYSASTRAMMNSIWRLYADWCKRSGLHVYSLDRAQLIAFMRDNPAARSTQQARATHLKNMIGEYVLQSDDVQAARCLAMLTSFKLPKTKGNEAMYKPRQNRRGTRALGDSEVSAQLIRTWETPEATARNRAVLALLFYTGVRRSEVGRAKWGDINFSNHVIGITGAKHRDEDHTDYVPLINWRELERHLRTWQAIALDASRRTDAGRASLGDGNPVYAFCEISKAGNLGEDKPIAGETIRRICGADFMPHDARRTLGTNLITNGTPINKVRDILRHKDAATTLDYARYADATDTTNVKLGY